jgi:hypothetical protein
LKPIAVILALVAMFAAACGGDGDDIREQAAANLTIPADRADAVAHAALPAVADLPGSGWEVIGQDEFGSGDNAFLEFIQGNPECETLENLAALEDVFGGGEDDDETPAGRAQVEFEQQDPDGLLPASVEVEVEIDQSSAGSRAEFSIVKALFESDDTSNCLISVLNSQFSETGPTGLQIEISKAEGSAEAPQNGARMAFDVQMSFAGIELPLAMQLYFWPYGNANVQALFLGTKETLTADLVGGVLETVDEKLQAAATGQ